MRFNDWDVLLFPCGENSLVPLPEFRTSCFSLQDRIAGTATPLVTCFVPSLPHNAGFHLSVHSWTKQDMFPNGPPVDVPPSKATWQVQIIVDGVCVGAQLYPSTVTWPQQIVASNILGSNGKSLPLSFPPFHGSFLSQTHWDASESLGRIKVELSVGCIEEEQGRNIFANLATRVIFAFQPAPVGLLERNGVSWPSRAMPVITLNRSPAGSNGQASPTSCHRQPSDPLTHKRRDSSGSIIDGSTRNTSSYPELPNSAYTGAAASSIAQSVAFSDSANRRMEVRLSSDQLAKIINALSPPASDQSSLATSMPPPPTPAKGEKRIETPKRQNAVTATQDLEDSTSAKESKSREESHCSDVSMHAGCSSFPICISEDSEGRVIHDEPASAVKGRKEGSSPTKQRDFLSTVLDGSRAAEPPKQKQPSQSILLSSSPGDGFVRKRTRSALKSLTLNDGSPEKMDVSTKPQRKISRIESPSSEEKENMNMDG